MSGCSVKAAVCLLLVLLSQCAAEKGAASYVYDAHGKRDPFVPLLGVAVASPRGGGAEQIMSIEDVELEGVLVSGDGTRNVIINGEVLPEGRTVGSMTIVDIKTGSVRIKIGEQIYEVDLYETDKVQAISGPTGR
ncbi:MAG: hypothetical protein GF392_04180 [Candidatus Omnitrophica bacterium]|nr:hypothetical protein [Candidatus Omnitrophota bacterium]